MAKKALGRGLGAIFGDDLRIVENRYSKNLDKPSARTVEEEVVSITPLDKDAREQGEENASAAGHAAEEDSIGGVLSMAAKSEPEAEKAKNVSRETFLPISRIEPNRSQPRKKFDEESLQELASSMKRFGVLQPLLVKQQGAMYEIIAGERRWRAAKLAGLAEVPVIVRSFDKQAAAEIAIIENIQREALGPIEEARAYQSLIQEYGLTQEEVAERVSKNRSTITNSLRLLQLSERVLALLTDGKLTAGHARALLMLTDKTVQEQLAAEIVERHLSVRDAERLAKAAAKAKKKQASETEQELNMYLIDAARKLTEHLGTKVQIRQGARGKGKVEIEYYNTDDLNKIMDRLRSE